MAIDKDAKTLGMHRNIDRRDFISGAAVAIAGTALKPQRASAQASPRVGAAAGAPPADYYPPKLTGLRGQHAGSFENAHKARDGATPENAAAESTGETYDLVVVGGGISGLSAAYFFRKIMGENKRVLVLDNHDDFGGHAKRNEFRHNGRLILAYGGTQSIQSPYPYSFAARQLIADIGIDIASYHKNALRNEVYKGLGAATFFDKAHWGRDKLVVGTGQKPWADFFKEAPMSAKVRAALTQLHTAPADYMPNLDPVQKAEALKKISYQQFLTDYAKLPPEALPYFAARGFRNNMRVDTCPAFTAARSRAAGFAGMKIDMPAESFDEIEAHFPDGNATITRLLVSRMIPDAWPGHLDMNSIQTAVLDYGKLDVDGTPVRLRLNSTVVNVEHDGPVATARAANVTYARGDKLYRVRGDNVIMACFNNIIRFIVPGLPDAQKDALAYASKVPMQYSNVLIRNWTSFKKLGIRSVQMPTCYDPGFSLDFPVSMGDYNFAFGPDDPIVVHFSRNPNKPGVGLSRRDQNRVGRQEMLDTPFETIERNMRAEMAAVLSGGGFDPAEDILGITVNRWPHGYAYTYDTLGDPAFAEHERPHVIGRRPFGRIAIANADAGAAAFTNEAIDQAHRAVHDVLYSRALV